MVVYQQQLDGEAASFHVAVLRFGDPAGTWVATLKEYPEDIGAIREMVEEGRVVTWNASQNPQTLPK